MEDDKTLNKGKLAQLISRYTRLNRIIAIGLPIIVVVICIAAFIVAFMGREPEDILPTNAVFDEDGNLTEILGNVSVCIDPGHGYDDPGADSAFLGDEYSEADINLDVALKVREILTKYKVNVIMTHDDSEPNDSVPQNEEGKRVIDPVWRADFANSNADISLFVSLHCDSYPQGESVNGVRIYYMPKAKSGEYAAVLAKDCADGIKNIFSEEVMLKPMAPDDAYYVIKHINVPSVLIEMGFITNAEDATDMLDDAWRQNMAEGIANGIIEYILN